ncbi:hypothetical protein J437_LFUL009408 [Ladona fulva]|uniref:Peptidase S1 domain-containing protein n=1 Tax=Ladona fulva TaxID=123851 RepID=A0A8K0P661_LADFU|nr:hypothetical protein J437_LFUL009408 [Ladona fulva]
MTAAHCVYGREYSEFSILAGTTDLHGNGSKIEAETVLPHEKYDPYDASNDIAVLKLKSPLTYSEVIQPVDLPSSVQMTPEGLVATVIGWGLTYTGGPAPTSLQYARLQTYSDEDCYRLHKNDQKPKPTNLCAGTPKGGKGQCSGDSGGPLMVNGYQAGIVSWSIKPCAHSGSPGVFTEVSYFVDWVKNRTWST